MLEVVIDLQNVLLMYISVALVNSKINGINLKVTVANYLSKKKKIMNNLEFLKWFLKFQVSNLS